MEGRDLDKKGNEAIEFDDGFWYKQGETNIKRIRGHLTLNGITEAPQA